MADDQQPVNRKTSVIEHGPAWITAIVGVISLLTGIFWGKATSSESAATTVTQTITETVTERAQASGSAPAATGTPQANSSSLFYSGDVAFEQCTVGGFSLDWNPPRFLDGKNLETGCGSRDLRAEDNTPYVLAEWTTQSEPSRDDCRKQVDEKGKSSTGKLVVGSYICGRTPEGRDFRGRVKGVPEDVSARLVVAFEVYNK
ncbi:hypothetical protein [Saccharothrix variisporea]|uniref:Uncharacterized protein n=1 Tax=Saccharothrix variisporea TaxID=543527 RepID=A0A495X4I9_9PSEU|nr:hypothetical protein [Saccharothrix variisporea]RKT69201.1 hypothetical protein DFJ66_2397 [Saccharothrix variisporea]